MLSLFVILGLLGVLWTGVSLRRGLRVTDRRVLDLVLSSNDSHAYQDDTALAA
jgi:hypothetical protein